MSETTTIGLDLAENVFQLHGADQAGKAVLRKKLGRDQGSGVLIIAATLRCLHGSLRWDEFLGP